MRRLVLEAAAGLIVAAILAPSATAQIARQDSVIGSGTAGPGFRDFEIRVESGPSGENPTGQVSTMRGITFSGPVTCLAVRSNIATVNIQTSTFGLVTLQFYDNSSAGTADVFQGVVSRRSPSDCSLLGSLTGLIEPVTRGDIVVTDARRLPTLKEQCKKGGWRRFGFKNQGACVSFVARGGRNPGSGA